MSLFRKPPEFDWDDTQLLRNADDDPPETRPLAAPRTEPRYVPAVAEPDTFPAIPAGDPRETGPMQRMPRLARVRQRPRPHRPADAALFLWSDLLEQHIMLCGVCPPGRRNRYADPIAGRMPFGFEALRVSAYVSGWRLDAFANWACPACQMTVAYFAPYSVMHYDAHAAKNYLAGEPDAERLCRQAAEHDLIRDVADAANHGRHAVRAS